MEAIRKPKSEANYDTFKDMLAPNCSPIRLRLLEQNRFENRALW